MGTTNNQVVHQATASNFVLQDSSWHHYVVTYDQSLASANLNFYRDGGNKETFNKGSATPSGSNASYALRVGAWATNGSYAMDTDMCDMAIWSRVITDEEVSALYNSGDGSPVITAARWVERGTA